jgi:ComF family protein
VCDVILDEPLRGCVCRRCWGAIRPITPPLCDRCGDPLPRLVEQCRNCHLHQGIIERARAIGEYDGALREVIHALKYAGRRSLAPRLAAYMRTRGNELLDAADAVVPVPLHWWREYQRGFNQARELAKHLGPPLIDVLIRTRHTRPQVELPADRRRENVEAAFGLRRPFFRTRSIEGARVVIVDDVSTTGATLEACARVLKKAGALEVYALTAARVVTRRRGVQI